MLKNALLTLKTRGLVTLIGAVLGLMLASIEEKILGRRFVQKRIFDYKMMLDVEDKGICRSLILFGEREIDHKIILEKVLKPDMLILDIGANIGYYALMELNMMRGQGRLIAVEPSPSNVELLKRNLHLNGYENIPVIAGAISDKSGTRNFFLAEQSNLNTFHDVGSGAQHLSGENIDVRTYTVPEVMEPFGSPDLIRMDVEGHEVEVFKGMLDAIRSGKMAPMVIFETHLTRYGKDHDMESVLRALFDAGYYVWYLASSWQKGTKLIEARGYKGSAPIKTDGVFRKIFENISNDDAVDFICHVGGARTVLLAQKTA